MTAVAWLLPLYYSFFDYGAGPLNQVQGYVLIVLLIDIGGQSESSHILP